MKSIAEKCSVYNNFIIMILLLGIEPIFRLLDYMTDKNTVTCINYIVFFQALIGIVLIYICSKKLLKKPLTKFLIILLAYIYIYYLISYLYTDEFIYLSCDDGNSVRIQTLKQYYLAFFKGNMSFLVIYLLPGINITKIQEILNKKPIKLLITSIYISIIILLIIEMVMSDSSNILSTIIFPIDEIYLYIGDTFALYSLLVYSAFNSKTIRFFIAVNSVYWLYKIGSRTSLYCFIVIFMLMLIKCLFTNCNIRKVIVTCTVIFIVSVVIWCEYDRIQTIELNNRMTIVTTNISEDSSYNSREIMLHEGMQDIREHWFWGNMFAEIKRHSATGDYVHNILSYWVEYGLLPFISIILLVSYNLYCNFKFYFTAKKPGQIELVFCLTTFIFLTTIFSRSYVYPYLWMALAASCDLYYRQKEKQLNSKRGIV